MITTSDGISLESLWDEPAGEPEGCVVLCHPHPLDGGTMNAPLMRMVAATLAASGLWVLRFNFRGVGLSQGEWGVGRGEVSDVAAAVAAAGETRPGLPMGVAGWSFGASTSLRWQAESGSTLPWAGIAPGIQTYRDAEPPDVTRLAPAPRLIVHGDRDQFASPAAMAEFASSFGARLEVLRGSDHFFVFRGRRVGALVAAHFGGRPVDPDGGAQT